MPGKSATPLNNNNKPNLQPQETAAERGQSTGPVSHAQRKTKSLEKPLVKNEQRQGMQTPGGTTQERFSGPSRSAEGVRKEMVQRQAVNEK